MLLDFFRTFSHTYLSFVHPRAAGKPLSAGIFSSAIREQTTRFRYATPIAMKRSWLKLTTLSYMLLMYLIHIN